MTPADLRKLRDVAKLIAEEELAELARARAHEAALRQEADRLTSRSRAISDPEQFRLNICLGTEQKWDNWKGQRLRIIQAERAKARVGLRAKEDAARKAFGREQALDALLQRALDANRTGSK